MPRPQPVVDIGGNHFFDLTRPDSDTCILFLGEGHPSCGENEPLGAVFVNPFGLEADNTQFYVENLATEYSVLTNADPIKYRPSSTWVHDVSSWIKSRYKYWYLIGYSAGGAATAYEITKNDDWAGQGGAIIIGAPVNWTDGWEQYPLFQSAQRADQTKTSICLIYGDQDGFWPQGELYYNNTQSV